MNHWDDEQLVATKNLIKTASRLGLITYLDATVIVMKINDLLRIRHGIFS